MRGKVVGGAVSFVREVGVRRLLGSGKSMSSVVAVQDLVDGGLSALLL